MSNQNTLIKSIIAFCCTYTFEPLVSNTSKRDHSNKTPRRSWGSTDPSPRLQDSRRGKNKNTPNWAFPKPLTAILLHDAYASSLDYGVAQKR